MKQKSELTDTIELRSEKVRKLVGEMPKLLGWIGMAVIVLIFVALVAALCLIPYPYSDGESILQHMLMDVWPSHINR